ncbi:MAG: 3D domain-containing protein [Dialister sp.]|nr:3D domain-containing protein [Dialister sp.]
MTHLSETHVKLALFGVLFMCIVSAQPSLTSESSVYAMSRGQKAVTVFDGGERRMIFTDESSLKKVLAEAHITLGRYDKYWSSTDEAADGTVIVVERSVPVTIQYQGKSKVVYTSQQTVQGAVNDAGYDWRRVMPVEDGLSRVHKDMVIHVVPYIMRTVTRTEALPITYTKWLDRSLAKGDMVVISSGRAGKRTIEAEEFISDGKVIKTNIIKSSVVDSGEPGVARTGDEAGTVGWVATMSATAYHPMDGGGLGITATGTKAGHGTVAVDPNVIPLGSVVYIPQYGQAIAADTGGAIKGNRIDLCMESYSECYNFGRQDVEVFVNY